MGRISRWLYEKREAWEEDRAKCGPTAGLCPNSESMVSVRSVQAQNHSQKCQQGQISQITAGRNESGGPYPLQVIRTATRYNWQNCCAICRCCFAQQKDDSVL